MEETQGAAEAWGELVPHADLPRRPGPSGLRCKHLASVERETVLPGGQGDASHPPWPYGQQNRELGPWGVEPDAFSGAVGSYGLCLLRPGAWAVSGKVNAYMQVSVCRSRSAALWLFHLKEPSGSEGI